MIMFYRFLFGDIHILAMSEFWYAVYFTQVYLIIGKIVKVMDKIY